MKPAALLLPLPLLLLPFAQAADYLLKFKEGSLAVAAKGHSRMQLPDDHSFDYNAKHLSFTVLSPAKAASVVNSAASHKKHTHGKSKAQVEEDSTKSVAINSTGRWFTFDDTDLHIWHGDFTDEQIEALMQDAGVDLLEKDQEIRFAELERTPEELEKIRVAYSQIHQDMMSSMLPPEMRTASVLKKRATKDNSPALEDLEKMRIGYSQIHQDMAFSLLPPEMRGSSVIQKRGTNTKISNDDDLEVHIPDIEDDMEEDDEEDNNEAQPDTEKPKHLKDSDNNDLVKKLRPPTRKVTKGALYPLLTDAKTTDVSGPNGEYMIQANAPSWGLPRVSQRNLPLHKDYIYPPAAGKGVTVYVIDTGINIDHVDFEGRARWGITTVPGGPNTDDNGHGTFVAGVIGSHTFGVAKQVELVAVKGLNAQGTSSVSQILAAIDWVIKQNAAASNKRNIANLSLGAGYSAVLNQAVDQLVQQGMFIVVAAGNGDAKNVGQDACNYSPASTPSAFTVGSTNINDGMSSYSNYGRCVNMYAPGERVKSTWIGPTNRETNVDSGTSFSSPNVAGIAALIMSSEDGDRADGSWNPKTIGNRLIQLGTPGVVRNFKGPSNTNLLAFNGVGVIGTQNNGKGGSSSPAPAPTTNNSMSPGFDSHPPTPATNGGDSSAGAPSINSVANLATLNALQTWTGLTTLASLMVVLMANF